MTLSQHGFCGCLAILSKLATFYQCSKSPFCPFPIMISMSSYFRPRPTENEPHQGFLYDQESLCGTCTHHIRSAMILVGHSHMIQACCGPHGLTMVADIRMAAASSHHKTHAWLLFGGSDQLDEILWMNACHTASLCMARIFLKGMWFAGAAGKCKVLCRCVE